MRYILIAALAAGIPASAQDAFLAGDALKRDILRCGEGCIVLDRAEAAALEHNIRMLVLQAHQVGISEGSARCKL